MFDHNTYEKTKKGNSLLIVKEKYVSLEETLDMPKVNLDALIPKADFTEDKTVQGATELKFLNLQYLMPKIDSATSRYHLFRKPDFQRETNNWDKKRIAELIESFIDESFIPSIILWQNPASKLIYVIDGAHRLSALLAWINNDYGDGYISQQYYNYSKIPDIEKELADETRTYINSRIGSFEDIKKRENGALFDNINNRNLDIQVIPGDVTKAEDSFFKINQQGVVISTTEKYLCKYRNEPISLASRIIIRGNSANQYWKNFTTENIQSVSLIADDLHNLLFKPPYDAKSVSVVRDHPLAGAVTSAMQVVFSFLQIMEDKNEKINNNEKINDTYNGSETVKYLTNARKICRIILSKTHGSLGLFPTIYFYNSIGKFIESAFLGMFQLILEKEKNNDGNFYVEFTKSRKRLELFLINNKIFITQISRKFGSAEKSARHIKGFFENVIKFINEMPIEAYSEKELIEKLKVKYEYLIETELDYKKPKSEKFSTEQKTAESNKEEIKAQPKCKICGGTLHPASKDFDHKIKRETKVEGLSNSENLQTVHFYCNNSREKLEQIGFYNPNK